MSADVRPKLVVARVRKPVVWASRLVQGPAGSGAGASNPFIVQHLAAAALSGHRAVLLNPGGQAVYASSDQPTALAVLGITTGAAASGATAFIQIQGEMVEPSWNWTPQALVFLGLNGLLTQAVPTSGYQVVLGVAQTPTSLFISLEPAIALA